MATKTTSKGKKIGRCKKKDKGRTTPLSAFVRNKISAEEYFKQTKQTKSQ
jgi:hypothetical protein